MVSGGEGGVMVMVWWRYSDGSVCRLQSEAVEYIT